MKSKNKLLIIGAGGHARSCIDVIEQNKKFEIVGLIDKRKDFKKIYKYSILGNDEKIKKLSKTIKYAIVCVGQIKSAQIRENLYKKLKREGFRIPVIISPFAYVSPRAKIGEGTMIMHGAVVNTDVVIGKNCIINTNSVIEHEVKIGNHCHVSTGSILNGNVTLGNKSFLGSGSVIREKIKIGDNCIVGANTFLKKNLISNSIFK